MRAKSSSVLTRVDTIDWARVDARRVFHIDTGFGYHVGHVLHISVSILITRIGSYPL